MQARSAKIAALIARAQRAANRYGTLAVLFTRWPLSTVGPYVNLVAGAIGMNWRQFMAFCLVGELAWVSLYLSLGYLARHRLAEAIDGAGRATLIGAALIVALVLGYWVIAKRRLSRRT